jgi:hypothetical protein
VFTAQETKTAPRIIEEDAESIGTSLLFKHGIVRDRTNELEFDADDFEGDRETMTTSAESSRRLLVPTTPPQVHLTRKNGEAFSDPRWSFAGKFNDHLLRRLASCKSQSASTGRVFLDNADLLCSEPRPVRESTSKASGCYLGTRIGGSIVTNFRRRCEVLLAPGWALNGERLLLHNRCE